MFSQRVGGHVNNLKVNRFDLDLKGKMLSNAANLISFVINDEISDNCKHSVRS